MQRAGQVSQQVFGIVRFSVVVNKAVKVKPWHVARTLTGDFYRSYKQALFSEERLSKRFNLFEAVTLPSLDAQTNKEFMVLVLVAEDLPAKWMKRLEALARPREYLRIVPVGHIHHVGDAALEVIQQYRPKNEDFITFRLDDDDALSCNYIELLSKELSLNKSNFVISFENGLYISRPGKSIDLLLEEKRYQCIGIGLAYKSEAAVPRTIFHFGNHKRVGQKVELLVKPQRKSWIRTLYPDSDSQGHVEHKVGSKAKIFSPEDLCHYTKRQFPLLDSRVLSEILEHNS